MTNDIDLTSVFSMHGGMRNRVTLPLDRLVEVLAFVEGSKS
jgi:hypothetical protein